MSDETMELWTSADLNGRETLLKRAYAKEEAEQFLKETAGWRIHTVTYTEEEHWYGKNSSTEQEDLPVTDKNLVIRDGKPEGVRIVRKVSKSTAVSEVNELYVKVLHFDKEGQEEARSFSYSGNAEWTKSVNITDKLMNLTPAQ